MGADFENVRDLDNLSDSELRRVVRDQLEEHEGIDPSDITINVQSGAVHLSGTVGTESELRVAEHVITDQLGIVEVHSELVVGATHRAISPSAIDEHVADEKDHEGLLLGDRPLSFSDESEHLEEDIVAELHGTTDVQKSIEGGIPWIPPESPTPEGYTGTDAASDGSSDDR